MEEMDANVVGQTRLVGLPCAYIAFCYWMRLAREPRAGSREKESGEQRLS
jgi:hypothetical protein